MIPKGTGGSNPSLSASFFFQEEDKGIRAVHMEKYPSGRRGSPAKGVVCESAARVQIPPSPPETTVTKPLRLFSFIIEDLMVTEERS